MSSHGRSGLGRALLGSVTDQVVRSARAPVIVVHPVLPAVHGETPKADAAGRG